MGRFTLRLPETLHHELEARARQEGVSLNQYIVYALTRQVAASYTIQVLSEENIKQQQARFEKLLESLGKPSTAETKVFLAEREVAELEDGLTDEIVTRVEAKMATANEME
jgi:hypothetical protein